MSNTLEQDIDAILREMVKKLDQRVPTEVCIALAKKKLSILLVKEPEAVDSVTIGDPFPKWKWKMDWCKEHGLSPTLGWGEAEEAWAEEAWAEDMERKIHIDRLSAEMNEFMTRRSTCNCCSDMEVDIHAASLFDFSLDDPPEG